MSRTNVTSKTVGPIASNAKSTKKDQLVIGSAATAWTVRLRHPIVLRLPRGYALLIGITLLALLLLAYWVGHQQGYDTAQTARRAEQEAEQAVFRRGVVQDSHIVGPGENLVAGSRAGDPINRDFMIEIHGPGHDPRQVGLNYFVLAHDTQPGAVALLNFLWHHGVDAAAFRKDNRGVYSVVALDHGFSKSELRGEARREYEQKLDRLGLQWEASQNGASFKKQGMFAQLHAIASHVEMITRKGQR